jgi:hypothetical protein
MRPKAPWGTGRQIRSILLAADRFEVLFYWQLQRHAASGTTADASPQLCLEVGSRHSCIGVCCAAPPGMHTGGQWQSTEASGIVGIRLQLRQMPLVPCSFATLCGPLHHMAAPDASECFTSPHVLQLFSRQAVMLSAAHGACPCTAMFCSQAVH